MVHPLDNRTVLRMNGAGNEILVLDLRGTDHILTPAEARAIAAQPELKFDQLMALHDPEASGVDVFMRIYNVDGSLSGACGNGTRCVAYALGREGKPLLRLATMAGEIETRREGDLAVVCVLDRGPGIPPEAVEKVLQPFTRLNDARSDTGGAGLGLAIVDRAARLHGGTVRLMPREGGGLVARVALPLPPPVPAPALPA